MNNLSNEQLKQIIETDHVQCGDAYSMARELLAYREAQGVVIELHMGAAIHVFDALKDTKIESNVRNANLGMMGASLVELWTSKIGGTLEYLTGNGGCSLKIYAAPQLPAVPDGWALVPLEATPEMLGASWVHHSIHAPNAWRTMVAAAPKPSSET